MMDLAAQAALVATGAVAGAAYVNGRLQLTNDWRDMRRRKQGERNFQKALSKPGSPCFELFRESATHLADHEAIWSRTRCYTWKESLDMVARYSHYFQQQHVQPGDLVAFYLMNSPDFLFAWMALLALGAAPALVNYNLAGNALLRCLDVSGAKMVLVDAQADCAARVHSVAGEITHRGLQIIPLDAPFKRMVEALSSEAPAVLDQNVNPNIGLMYTSGSTGMPKAMLVGMQRAYCTASVRTKTFGQIPGAHGDRTYHCMPLYHGTGGIAALIDLMGGLSVAIAPKFSVSSFWADCIESQSTIFLYVGEIIRYLLAAPPSPQDRAHRIRLVWGNGLRPDVWVQFQERFGVREIGEFFATTEGMLTLVNHSRNELSVGAVGHHGWIARQQTRNSYVSVRVNGQTGDIYRHPQTGKPEPTPLAVGGEILIRVPHRSAWQGYHGAASATQSKFLADVFEPGDLFYRTGDALRRTPDGYWYFLDRLGDTYRWKGENVSTTEVAHALGSHPQIAEANVYGVSVPGHDGRVGCVALRLTAAGAGEDWATTLPGHLRAQLPRYAIPIFIRLVDESESMATGNHKHRKGPLQDEGIDLSRTGTRVPGGERHRFFWLKPGAPGFVAYTGRDWDELRSGRIRL